MLLVLDPLVLAMIALGAVYVWLGTLAAVLVWQQTQRPPWRAWHWLKIVVLGPSVYALMIVEDWVKAHARRRSAG